MEIFGAIQPSFEGCRKVNLSVRCRISVRPAIGGRRNVKRDAQVAVLGADFFQRDDAGKTGCVREFFVGLDDVLNVIVGQKTLGAFAGDFVDGVDEQDFALSRLGLGSPADDDTRFHR